MIATGDLQKIQQAHPSPNVVRKPVIRPWATSVDSPVAEKDLALPAGVAKDPAKMIAKLGLKGKAALAPMLAMLKGLYQTPHPGG